MAKNKISILFLWLICLVGNAIGQRVLENYPVLPETTLLRQKLISVAETQVGIREKSGHNDGKDISKYLLPLGLHEGDAYCAAGLAWCHEICGIPHPKSGFSPDWFKINVVYRKGEPRSYPFIMRPGQVGGLFIASKNRIGHVVLLTNGNRTHYEAIGFNTNGMNSYEGEGVYHVIYRKESISVISDYAGYEEISKVIKIKNNGTYTKN